MNVSSDNNISLFKRQLNKIKMNIFHSIKFQRKSLKFSNPLSGITFDNNRYLNECRLQLAECPKSDRTAKRRKGREHTSLFTIKRGDESEQKNCQSRNQRKQGSLTEFNVGYRSKATIQTHQLWDIQIKVIDQIYSAKDLSSKFIKVNFSEFFKLLFRRSLAGQFTEETLNLISMYMQNLIETNRLDEPVNTKIYPSFYFNMTEKKKLAEKIDELEGKGQFRLIEEIIKYYCVPPRQLRTTILQNLIFKISQQLFEKYDINRDSDIRLLDENGYVISELCAIKLTARTLLVSEAGKNEGSYQRYRQLLQSSSIDRQKSDFRSGLKQKLRLAFVGKLDEESENSSFLPIIKRRDISLNREKKHLKNVSVQFSKPALDDSLKIRGPSHLAKSISLDHYSRIQALSRVKHKQVSVPSPKAERHCKDRSFSQTKPKAVYPGQKANNEIVLKETQFCRSKTDSHICNLILALGKDKDTKTINQSQFKLLKDLSLCRADPSTTIHFICSFLGFDQQGYLTRSQVESRISVICSQQPNAIKVVSEVLWNWFQQNNTIEEDKLKKSQLEAVLLKNPNARAFLIGYIFREKDTLIDIAYEVIV